MSTIHKKYFNTFYSFVKENQYKFILIFLIYFTAILSIGIVNYQYNDDCFRQISGATDF